MIDPQTTRNLAIVELETRLNELYEEVGKLESQLNNLKNIRYCDICEATFDRWHNGYVGGTDFTESGLEPVMYEGKLINCVCMSCIMKRWRETDEAH